MGSNGSLLLLLVLFAVVLWMSSRSRRRVQRQHEETLARLAPGTEIVTTAGLHGTVVEVLDDGTVRLETAPGQTSRWERRAVARVVADAGTAGAGAADLQPEPGTEPGPTVQAEPGAEPALPVDRSFEPDPPTPLGSAPLGSAPAAAPEPPAPPARPAEAEPSGEGARPSADGVQDPAPPDRA